MTTEDNNMPMVSLVVAEDNPCINFEGSSIQISSKMVPKEGSNQLGSDRPSYYLEKGKYVARCSVQDLRYRKL
jgi:hypothetical protein